MKKEVYEYDGYKIPKPLKNETPETKRKRAEALEKLNQTIVRHLSETKKVALE